MIFAVLDVSLAVNLCINCIFLHLLLLLFISDSGRSANNQDIYNYCAEIQGTGTESRDS